jgi:hypothetical protein
MPEAPIDNRTLLRRTFVTAGAMVAASVLLVGALTLVASTVAGRAFSSESADVTHASGAIPPPPLGGAPKSK